MTGTRAIALVVLGALVACGGVPFETVPLVVGPDAGVDAPSASSSSSSSSSGGASSSSSSGSVDPPDSSSPPPSDAAPELEAETGPAPPVDACAPVMHSNGVAACVRETFVDCTTDLRFAVNDACLACTGGAFGCNTQDVCADPTGGGASDIACACIVTDGGKCIEACWAYKGLLAGHACISTVAGAGDCCPTLDDPRWY
jgi:hypothetical protein